MMSYRTPFGYDHKFGRERSEKGQWQVASYLEHQGVKFQGRFDPMAYVKLTEQMDSHDIGRNRGGKEAAMKSITQPVLVMGIESDILYPLYQQEELVRHIPNSRLQVVSPWFGAAKKVSCAKKAYQRLAFVHLRTDSFSRRA